MHRSEIIDGVGMVILASTLPFAINWFLTSRTKFCCFIKGVKYHSRDASPVAYGEDRTDENLLNERTEYI